MKKVAETQVTCKNAKGILHFKGHLSLSELQNVLSEKGLLESDFNDDDDDDIQFSYLTINEGFIVEDFLDKEGNIYHSSELKIEG